MNRFVSRFRAGLFSVGWLSGMLCLLLAVLPAFGIGLENRKSAVTLFTEFQQFRPDSVQRAIQAELELIMSPADMHFDWRSVSESEQRIAGRAVRVRFKGACNTAGLRAKGETSRPLGWTSITDGAILPFIDVDCDGVRNIVQGGLWSLSDVNQERAFGRAVARVLANELYHFLGNAQTHTSSGIGKAFYNRNELVSLSAECRFRR